MVGVGRLRGGATDLGRSWCRIRGMVRLRLAIVCALGVLLLVPQAAVGGGWWSHIDVNRSHVAPGQRVELEASVAFSSAAAAQAAQRRQTDPFYVYLLRGFDYAVVEQAMRKPSPGKWWSLGGAEAIKVGRVTVSVSDANLGRATAAFTVPQLPPATYHLMLCDVACREPLADVIPAQGLTVVADPATARIANRVDRMERRSRNQAGQLAATRADTDQAPVGRIGPRRPSNADRPSEIARAPAFPCPGDRAAGVRRRSDPARHGRVAGLLDRHRHDPTLPGPSPTGSATAQLGASGPGCSCLAQPRQDHGLEVRCWVGVADVCVDDDCTSSVRRDPQALPHRGRHRATSDNRQRRVVLGNSA
jgi:hypothetical protein